MDAIRDIRHCRSSKWFFTTFDDKSCRWTYALGKRWDKATRTRQMSNFSFSRDPAGMTFMLTFATAFVVSAWLVIREIRFRTTPTGYNIRQKQGATRTARRETQGASSSPARSSSQETCSASCPQSRVADLGAGPQTPSNAEDRSRRDSARIFVGSRRLRRASERNPRVHRYRTQ